MASISAPQLVFTGEKPNNGVYSWPTPGMVCPISIALPDGISWRDTARGVYPRDFLCNLRLGLI
jgi:hypothetical protein